MQEEHAAMEATESLPEQEVWDEDEQYEDDDDDDIDAEAQEIARRLGEQLWADISMANAQRNVALPTDPSSLPADGSVPTATSPSVPPPGLTSRKEEAALETMKAILALIENDPPAKDILFSTAIPGTTNVLNVLQSCIAINKVDRSIAAPLSQIIIALARSEALFASLKNTDAATVQLDKGKRKRDEVDDGEHHHQHAYKRLYVPSNDLQNQMFEAVRIISQALGSSPPQPLDPALISSIRIQLHQVFLFAVTFSAVRNPHTHILQEISGLIQALGVLSGIQIGQDTMPPSHTTAYPWPPVHPAIAQSNIGTAVYPCLVAGCHKIFSRLYGLRAHQRSHASHRPFRCSLCPASFARNHDLKRHVKLHDKKAWRCEGCAKVFSRRDAIKRHKNGVKNKGPRSEICLSAGVTEVQLDEEDGEDILREERRAKLWNGISINEAHNASLASSQVLSHMMEEGEIDPAVIGSIQASVLSLHGLLQSYVSASVGTPPGQAVFPPHDPSTGHATLASVIARAQGQNTPPESAEQPLVTNSTPSGMEIEQTPIQGFSGPEETSMHIVPLDEGPENPHPLPSLSMYGLSDEQAHLLEIAIANAAQAAQAQAEAEAALEEEEEGEDDDDEYEEIEVEQNREPN